MQYQEAIATLPAGAKWSASFGNPGEGGYSEFHRMPDGTRYVVANGTWMDFAPFQWTVSTLPAMPPPPASDSRRAQSRELQQMRGQV